MILAGFGHMWGNQRQLMLTMLARFGHVGKPGPVDVRHMGTNKGT